MVTATGSLAIPGSLNGESAARASAGQPGESVLGWSHDLPARLARYLMCDPDDDAIKPVPMVTVPAPERPSQVAAARLEGVKLTAREVAHLVNNDLTVSVAALDLLRSRNDITPHVRAMVEQALAGLNAATEHVAQLQRVNRVVTRETPAGPSLDLERSI